MRRETPDPIPPLRKHKGTGQGYVLLDGRRRYLGKHDRPETRRRYLQVIQEWEASGRRAPAPAADLTVVELTERFYAHAVKHYRNPDGSPGRTPENFKPVIRLLTGLYGETPAREFTPVRLKAVRHAMIEKGWCRTNINRQIVRIRTIVRWAVSEGLVEPAVYHALQAVDGLRAGRSGAIERPPVRVVPEHVVTTVLPHLSPVVGDMVRVQLWTGMRPGELCAMRPADLDLSGKLWLYRPASHKSAWRGRERVIVIGPRGQRVLRKYLSGRPVDKPIFSPAESEARRRELVHAKR